MNIGTFYDSDLGRRLYQEIGMIEEQHVTQYGALLDPGMTWLENLLLHEYTECYLYWSCVEDETDLHIKKIWEQHFEQECSHLHAAEALLKQYEGKEAVPDHRMGLSRNCCALAPRKNICARCSKPPC